MKRQQQQQQQQQGEESGLPAPPPLPPKKARGRKAAAAATTASAAAAAPAEEQPSTSAEPVVSQSEDAFRWQKGRDLIELLLTPLKVDASKVTLLPDRATLEALRGACQTWLNNNGVYPQLSYSDKTCFTEQMARFLLQLVLQSLGDDVVNVTGCAIWPQPEDHGAALDAGRSSTVRCYHGDAMTNREHVIEMDVNSEAGKRALEEQSAKTRVTQNRWGRNVVQLVNAEALCCRRDVKMPSGQHSTESCGMFFTEGPKVRTALAQYAAYQGACYPAMPDPWRHVLAVVRCRCNWQSCGSRTPLTQLGRQLCRVTPFQLSGASRLSLDSFEDERLRASIRYPALLVYQCCNPPVGRRGGFGGGSGGGSEPTSCDWKLSAPDLLNACQQAKNMWRASLDAESYPLPPLRIPELRWHDSLRFQSALLPQQIGAVVVDENPFDSV